MVRTCVDLFIFVQWLENGRLVVRINFLNNIFLALHRTSLFVEAVLRGPTDFIKFFNLIIYNFWEFVEAAIITQNMVLFMILLFQLVYV